MNHELKINPEYYKEVVKGNKKFEVRKDDRNFKTGDTIVLREFSQQINAYTGNSIKVEITYILKGGVYGLGFNQVVLGIEEYEARPVLESVLVVFGIGQIFIAVALLILSFWVKESWVVKALLYDAIAFATCLFMYLCFCPSAQSNKIK